MDAALREIGENATGLRSDVSSLADLDLLYAQIKEQKGRLDILFANAGGGRFMPLEQVTEALFDETFNVNVKGVLFTVQKALPLMKSGSAIVLMASINGHKAMLNSSVYAASKAAVISLAKNLAIELVDRGIRVNSVSPGPIETALLSRNLSAQELQQTKDWIISKVPMKRFGQPEDIAAVLYLTSPESAFVTGADLIVDGGMDTLS